MPDPVTTVGLGAITAYLGKDGLQKLLGPTADYLGGGLKTFTQHRLENIGRIFQKAEKKVGPKINEPGVVPPRVLKEIINEGSYFDDELAAEYFGGVLASSRTEHGRDDRGARAAKLIDRLSTYQLRTHYLVYGSIQKHFGGSGYRFSMEDRPKMQIFIPISSFVSDLDLNSQEVGQIMSILNHVFFGLHSEDLIEGHFQFGPKESMERYHQKINEEGIICQPSALGAELFLYALGAADKDLRTILDKKITAPIEGIRSNFANSLAIKKET